MEPMNVVAGRITNLEREAMISAALIDGADHFNPEEA